MKMSKAELLESVHLVSVKVLSDGDQILASATSWPCSSVGLDFEHEVFKPRKIVHTVALGNFIREITTSLWEFLSQIFLGSSVR